MPRMYRALFLELDGFSVSFESDIEGLMMKYRRLEKACLVKPWLGEIVVRMIIGKWQNKALRE